MGGMRKGVAESAWNVSWQINFDKTVSPKQKMITCCFY
jgi:hypothetical protein